MGESGGGGGWGRGRGGEGFLSEYRGTAKLKEMPIEPNTVYTPCTSSA